MWSNTLAFLCKQYISKHYSSSSRNYTYQPRKFESTNRFLPSFDPSFVRSFLPSLLPPIIKYFNVYCVLGTLPGTRIQWCRLYSSLILQPSVNLRLILNLKSDLTTFLLTNGEQSQLSKSLGVSSALGFLWHCTQTFCWAISLVPHEIWSWGQGNSFSQKVGATWKSLLCFTMQFLAFPLFISPITLRTTCQMTTPIGIKSLLTWWVTETQNIFRS